MTALHKNCFEAIPLHRISSDDCLLYTSVGFKEVTTFKQTAAGNYTFFVTASQASLTGFAELPVILLTAITGGCSACMVNDPIMSLSLIHISSVPSWPPGHR